MVMRGHEETKPMTSPARIQSDGDGALFVTDDRRDAVAPFPGDGPNKATCTGR